jgi:tetratricopeptide (TPR) repeat protein
MTKIAMADVIALHSAGRLAEAEAACRSLLAADPENPETLHTLGVLSLQSGKPGVAVEMIAAAIRRNPASAPYFSNLGSALRRLGRLDDAIAAGREALRIDGDFIDGLINLTNALCEKGAFAEAAPLLRRVIERRPNAVDQRLLLARTLILSNQNEEAVTAMRDLLRIAPRHAPAYINLGVALKKLGRFDEAVAAYRAALDISPNDPGALNNLGTTYQEEDRNAEAIDCFRQAVAARPGYADAHLNLSLALRAEGRLDESIGEARTAIAMNPNLAEAHTSLGFNLLLKGELIEGFKEYEWRTAMNDFSSPRRSFETPAWNGEDLAGKTVLIHDEQGIGDAIQFVRYAPLLRGKGARVIVECNTQLTRLFGSMPGIDQAIGRFTQPPPHDYHVSLLSLPHLLGTRLDTIPADVPYLRAEPELVARWAERLNADGPALRVGVVWAGNPEFREDRNRSPGLAAFLPLFDVPGTRFYALQKGPGRRDLPGLRDRLPENFIDLDAEIGNLADTAAIMMNLHLVISSCTAPPHLAGALARPTWTILPQACDWRWLAAGDVTPWYPTMRLFRQQKRGDWATVTATVRAALEDAARHYG